MVIISFRFHMNPFHRTTHRSINKISEFNSGWGFLKGINSTLYAEKNKLSPKNTPKGNNNKLIQFYHLGVLVNTAIILLSQKALLDATSSIQNPQLCIKCFGDLNRQN